MVRKFRKESKRTWDKIDTKLQSPPIPQAQLNLALQNPKLNCMQEPLITEEEVDAKH